MVCDNSLGDRLLFIMIGNAVVWRGIAQVGLPATGGEMREVLIDGLYRY